MMYHLRAVFLIAATTLITACGGGGSSTPAPTPTPAPGAVVVSPNPVVLTVSAGALHATTLTVTQTNAAGNPTLTTTCYGGTGTAFTGAPSIVTQGLNGGTYTGTFSAYTGLVAGSCTIAVAPATGTTVIVPVTVGP